MKDDIKIQQFKEAMLKLSNLNPDISFEDRGKLFLLAGECGEKVFTWTVEFFEKLLIAYQKSPVKKYGQYTLQEYFFELEKNALLLQQAGEIKAIKTDDKKEAQISTAIIPFRAQELSVLDRCKLLNRAEIPQSLTRAADAFLRRSEVVETVLEIALKVLWLSSEKKTKEWILFYLKDNAGNLDPDIIREILRVSFKSKNLDRDFLAWAETWSADESLLEYWPSVTAVSDKLLCHYALRNWQKKFPARNGILAHLHLLIEEDRLSDEQLGRWLSNALESFAECVERFTGLGNQEDQEDKNWLRIALFRELSRICSLYRPILIICDHLLRLPDGANSLAMAFLGLIGKGFNEWEERILLLAEKVIERSFLYGLKNGKAPAETIEQLTFGDQIAFNFAMGQLDLLSGQFDSFQQRDKVVRFLSSFYASYRRPQLLGVEVAKRYRNLMRMLHEDYINNILDKEQIQELQKEGLLREISAMAAAARQFLDKRRALKNSLEEMVASEMEFIQESRNKRLAVIRKMLD